MEDHVHMGILWVLSVAAAVAIVNVTARTVAAHNSDRPIGRALTYVFG